MLGSITLTGAKAYEAIVCTPKAHFDFQPYMVAGFMAALREVPGVKPVRYLTAVNSTMASGMLVRLPILHGAYPAAVTMSYSALRNFLEDNIMPVASQRIIDRYMFQDPAFAAAVASLAHAQATLDYHLALFIPRALLELARQIAPTPDLANPDSCVGAAFTLLAHISISSDCYPLPVGIALDSAFGLQMWPSATDAPVSLEDQPAYGTMRTNYAEAIKELRRKADAARVSALPVASAASTPARGGSGSGGQVKAKTKETPTKRQREVTPGASGAAMGKPLIIKSASGKVHNEQCALHYIGRGGDEGGLRLSHKTAACPLLSGDAAKAAHLAKYPGDWWHGRALPALDELPGSTGLFESLEDALVRRGKNKADAAAWQRQFE
jgi:hypothetical protein